MHVLIANDDGIFAPGIRALAKAAAAAGHRVTVFAPDEQRSAAGHSFSITKPLHAKPVEYGGIRAFSVDGTPADCARLGLYLLKDDPVDFVLAGINKGANRGAAILYSGTVGAAMEASLCGVPGLAVSLCSHLDRDYEEAAALDVRAMEWAVHHPLPRGEIYNLNVPYGVKIRGVRSASISNEYIFPPDYLPDGAGGYVLAEEQDALPETDPNSDLNLTNAGYASMQVLTWKLLSDTPMPDLSDLAPELEEE